jgi:3-hydroxy-9,10-secoandrosta-1,3,5(10)-triene-9,17-dione monooxygenase
MSNTSITAPETPMSADIMLQRARDMVPVLRARAAEADRQRTVSHQTIEEFRAAGFYRILQARRFGGYQLGLRAFCDVMIEISRGCSSSGWVLCLTSAHAYHVAAFPEAGQIEVFGDDGEFRAPLIFAPGGIAVAVDGGYRLHGNWNYNSGGEHANWVILAAVVPGATEQAAPIDLVMAAIRREDYDIVDNWNVMGMRATASKQAVVSNVFVPASRMISQIGWLRGNAPGYGVHADAFYRSPPMEVFAAELACVCVGLGEAAIDAFQERIATKVNAFPPFEALKHDRSSQRRLGHARARVDTAAAALDRIINLQMQNVQQIEAGTHEFSSIGRRRVFMLAQQVERLVSEAVNLIYDASGSSAAQNGQHMERLYRDLATMRTHYVFDLDRSAENWGAMALGLKEYSPF